MFRTAIIGAAFFATCSMALAACPPPATGNTAEAIRANGQRLICLQNELAEATRQRQQQFEFDQLRRRYDADQIQRRFDALPKIPVYTPPAI